MGRRALPRSGDRLRLDSRRTTKRRRRSACGQVVDGCTCTRRTLVRRYDQEPVATGRDSNGFEWFVRWSSFGYRGGPGRFLNRHGNTRVDCFTIVEVRRYGIASDVRKGEPVRSDGVELDHGQDRSDMSRRGGLCRRVECDLWS